jgi:hypothetical protein
MKVKLAYFWILTGRDHAEHWQKLRWNLMDDCDPDKCGR